jgi:hypothetical protein
MLGSNPLPVELVQNAREYCMTHSDTKNINTMDDTQYLPLSEHAHMISMRASDEWRRVRGEEVRRSVEALSIADEVTSRLEKEEMNRAAGVTASTALTVSKRENKVESGQNAVENSEFYTSPDQLRQIIAEVDRINSSDPQLIDVCYGRIGSLLLGVIRITSSSTYSEAHRLIRPLVVDHVKNVEAGRVDDLVENYTLFDPFGGVVIGSDMVVSIVWVFLSCVFNKCLFSRCVKFGRSCVKQIMHQKGPSYWK